MQEKEDHLVKGFLKGAFRLRPTFPKYHHTWDPSLVQKFLETLNPVEAIKLDALSYKLSTLLALVSAQRVQTWQALKFRT